MHNLEPFCQLLSENDTMHLMTVGQTNCCRENSLGEEVLETLCFTFVVLTFLSLIGLVIITIFEAKREMCSRRRESQINDDEVGYMEFVDLDKGPGQELVKNEATLKSMNEIKDLYEEIPDTYVEAYAMQVNRDDSVSQDVIMEDDTREDEDVNRMMNLLFVDPIRNAQCPPSPIPPCTLPRMVEEEPQVTNWNAIRKQLKRIRNMKVGLESRGESSPDAEREEETAANNWNSVRKELKKIRNMKVGMEIRRVSSAEAERSSSLSWRDTIMEEINRRASTMEVVNRRDSAVGDGPNFTTTDKRSSSVISGLSNASRDSRLSMSSCRNSSITSDGSTDHDQSLDYGGSIMSHKSLRRSFKRKKAPKVSSRARSSNSSSICGKNISMSPELEQKGDAGRRAGIMKKSPSNGALNNYKKKRRQGVSFHEQDHPTGYGVEVISRHPNIGKTTTEA